MTTAGASTIVKRKPARRVARRFRLAVPVVSLAIALMWYVAATIVLGREDAERETEAIDVASRAFADRMARDQLRVANECQFLSEDPRFKGMLAKELDSPSIDGFVRHVADQVIKRSLIAVLAPDARVIASSAGKLTGGNLATTAAVKGALKHKTAVSGVWNLDGAILNVAVRRITLGDQILALLVVGAAVDDDLLRDVERVASVHGAVAVGPNVLASSGPVEDFQPQLDLAVGQTVRRGSVVVRNETIEPAAVGARALWRRPVADGTRRTAFLLVPVLAAFGLGVFQARRADGH